MILEAGFLQDVIKRFQYYKTLGDQTFEQLLEEDMIYQPSAESNSIALIVKHMHGNMLSRWTDCLTTDGEKEWRNRDAEFEVPPTAKSDIIRLWEEGWNCLFTALNKLTATDLSKTITIRSEPLLVYDAILRQLAHYPYHVGQIVYIGKILRNQNWHSLSIPKGNSQTYLEQLKNTSEK